MTREGQGGVGFRTLVMGACFVIIVAGLKAASPVLLPVLVALFITVISIPPITWMRRHGAPRWAATLIIFTVVLCVIGGVSVFVGAALRGMGERWPEYQASLDSRLAWLETWLAQQSGAEIDLQGELARRAGDAKDGLSEALGAVTHLVSESVFVLITAVFMLAEAAGLPAKLRAAFGADARDLDRYDDVIDDLQGYLAIKTQTALLMGVLVGGACALVGVDYAVLWGLLSFLLHFVPTLGSIIAAGPAVALAFIQYGWERAVIMAVFYFAMHTLVGSLLEPRLMGKRLGLSTLVVFLSLVFWGYIWGPVGMVLCVPLTMAVKIILQNSRELHWLAVMLSSGVEVRQEAADQAQPGE